MSRLLIPLSFTPKRITLRQGFYLATFQLQENLLPVGLWLPQRKNSASKS